ncbi:MAG TPA: CpsD/CapB family tyrosine-protein kinase [Vicinamibacterales bacterium]|nr:CpsD/CapB family tyrosine-protein kinase [Vicinamibacterales bacterium]
MSRINEALRRVGDADPAAEPAADGQPHFAPAWPVSGVTEAPGEPEAATPATPPAPVRQAELRRESERAVAPAGTTVQGFSSKWRECLASGPEGDPGLIEQFRRLAGTLHHAQHANGLRSVMVTSAAPGDGKTLTAVNLALVLSESYRANVLLVDADLRRPSIPSVVESGQGAGLSEALRAATEQKLALVNLTPRLTLLPAGQPIANSLDALTSPRMQQILKEATTRFDWVILDAPPVGPTADARLLTEMVGGTLFVVHAGKTQCPEVQKAIDAIGSERILGVVLNGVAPEPHAHYYGVVPAGSRD